jgi:glycine/D-amino acid oxidase-like deaminating enzyme
MRTRFLIIGQGVSGSFLSWYLHKAGEDFLVIDNNNIHAPSRIAAGIINPVTGRRLVTVWMANELFPFAWSAYNEIGAELGITAISQKNIIDFFPNPFMKESFLKKIEEKDPYTSLCVEDKLYTEFFNYEFGCGQIEPVYTAHLEALLPAWRNQLKQKAVLREEQFEQELLQVNENKIEYKDIIAEKIIYCDGTSSFDNRFFKNLPFAPNKGEALVVEIPGLPNRNTFKKSMLLTPLLEKDLFWVGSSYAWDFDDADPTSAFKDNTTAILKEWIKIPFKIVEHRSGLRPATLERRPFVGLHPIHPEIGILNGMGTKGCSLAPFFANQLCNHLLTGAAIAKDADVHRFSRVLSRG